MEFWKPGIVKTPVSHCLDCGTKFTASSSMDGHDNEERAGQLAVCLLCGAVMIYADDLTVRALTDAEIEEVTNDEALMKELARQIRAIHVFRATRN